jgi:hypothetical protein
LRLRTRHATRSAQLNSLLLLRLDGIWHALGAIHYSAAGRHLRLRLGCHQADGAVRGAQRQELPDGAHQPRAHEPAGAWRATVTRATA